MMTKLKIKMGHIEFEYEGEAVYDKEAVKDLFSHIESLAGAAPPGTFDSLPPLDESESDDGGGNASADIVNFSMQTVAARLGGKTARDVALAAATYLQVCQEKNSFTRGELLENMKKATGYYNQSMRKNLIATLQRLVAGKVIMMMTGDKMSLSASEQARLKAELAKP